MQSPRLRPTFTVQLPMVVDDAMIAIRKQIADRKPYGKIVSKGRCVEMFVADDDKRMWSPYLSIQAQEEGGETVLFGRFSPCPEVWTFVIFLYAMNAFFIVFGAMFAYGQWFIEQFPWGLIGVIVGGISILIIHLTSMIGQRLSSDQMHHLRGNLDDLIQNLTVPTE